jgi:hypothetical protein
MTYLPFINSLYSSMFNQLLNPLTRFLILVAVLFGFANFHLIPFYGFQLIDKVLHFVSLFPALIDILSRIIYSPYQILLFSRSLWSYFYCLLFLCVLLGLLVYDLFFFLIVCRMLYLLCLQKQLGT